MKQKITVKVQMHCQKCRTKALKIAANIDGVDKVAIEGKEKDQVVVIGDGVDPVTLTTSLRKVGRADIVSVVGEKTKDEKEPSIIPITHYSYEYPRAYTIINDQGSDSCTIM